MSERKNKGRRVSVTKGQPRRKVRTIIKRTRVTVTTVGMLAILVGTGVWWSLTSNGLASGMAKVRWDVISRTAQVGFRVEDILVVGRLETPRKELLEAVRLSTGAPILAFDIEAARQRVEQLPWIRSARVERMLPDTILMNVEERQPLVLWQHQGQFALIDHEGEVILRDGLERFSNLVVVVGEEAPVHAAALMETLGNEPELLQLVEAAVWVGGRRWNIRLAGDIDVRLPEKNAKGAWTRLAEYERAHSVLARDVQVLDLRLPDRLIVRKAPSSTPPVKNKGRET